MGREVVEVIQSWWGGGGEIAVFDSRDRRY